MHTTKVRVAQKSSDGEIYEQFGVLKDRILKNTANRSDDLSNQNAFKLFDIEQKFAVNKNKLHKEMFKLQKILHPDKYTRSNRATQDISYRLSTLVNQQYQMLKNPYERGKYLLSLVSNKKVSDVEDQLDKLKLDDEFLTEMMDIQERLQGRDQGEIRKIQIMLEIMETELTNQLERDFKENNTESILRNLGKMKFITNCYKTAEKQCGPDSL